jgi:hypothetical protein
VASSLWPVKADCGQGLSVGKSGLFRQAPKGRYLTVVFICAPRLSVIKEVLERLSWWTWRRVPFSLNIQLLKNKKVSFFKLPLKFYLETKFTTGQTLEYQSSQA